MDNYTKPIDREQHFKIFQGATFIQPIQWKYGDGTPVNITDYIVRWQIRPSATSIVITATGEFEIVDAINGMFLLKLSEEKTKLIPAQGSDYSKLSKYVYDVEMVSPDGVVSRILNGFILVSPEVTK